MPTYHLVPHPAFPPLAVRGVDVEVTSNAGKIALLCRVEGAAGLVVPAPAAPDRTDGLWKTTCFELFLKPAGEPAYIELNFAPSGEWAAYVFDDYRAGMRDLDTASPQIVWAEAELSVTFRHPGLVPRSTRPLAPTTVVRSAPWTPAQVRGDEKSGAMGLCAVIEEEVGRKSYWALAHGDGPPDFHNPDCFIATLPAPSAA